MCSTAVRSYSLLPRFLPIDPLLAALSHSISHWKVLKWHRSGKWRGALTLLLVTVPAPSEGWRKGGDAPNPRSRACAWGSQGSARVAVLPQGEEPPKLWLTVWRVDPCPARLFPPASMQAGDTRGASLGTWGRLCSWAWSSRSTWVWGKCREPQSVTWVLWEPQWDSKKPWLNTGDKVLSLQQHVGDNRSTQIGLVPHRSLYLRC